MPRSIFDPMPQIYATTYDGQEHFLFEYYPDELSFTPAEFKGLTVAEARALKVKKDLDYLASNI